MALPDDFSPAQHLLEMLISTHNKGVQQTFVGVPDNDIEHALGGMKLACLLTIDDTVDMILLRLMLFWFEFKGELPTPVYSIPVEDYQSELQIPFRPQIKLLFQEDWSIKLAENKFRRATAQISWRLIHQTSQTISPVLAKELATIIKQNFSLNHGFTWEKGHTKVVYKDAINGIYFQLLAASEGEAVRVIEKVLGVAGVSYNIEHLSIAQSRREFPATPGFQEIYGKERRKPRKRPITMVRFFRAELHVYGLPSPVVLVDTLNRGNPLVN
ncbi:MAG: hypothetical protein H0X31_00910 [Nostocaceae cyanobacterium]|nr:hypothetical protein [Nostocaceae cyanobacterium]